MGLRNLPVALVLTFLLGSLSFLSSAYGQTATYHLHKETLSGSINQLKTAGPDAGAYSLQSASLKNAAAGEYLVKMFGTQPGVPNASGVIPAGTAVAFDLWMKKTANYGTMVPRASLSFNNSTTLCTATGASALTTTLTKYTLACTLSSGISMTPADRFYVWAGVNMTAGPGNKDVKAQLYVEGALNGNYDSQVVVPLPASSPTTTTSTTTTTTISPTTTTIKCDGKSKDKDKDCNTTTTVRPTTTSTTSTTTSTTTTTETTTTSTTTSTTTTTETTTTSTTTSTTTTTEETTTTTSTTTTTTIIVVTSTTTTTTQTTTTTSTGVTTTTLAIPPDPATVAPPLDPTKATSLAAATEFLYTGSNPIQTGMTPGTIVQERAAVLRGKVMDISGQPLPGVTINILNHPEYGQTISRLDGMFDLVVNGGAPLIIRYRKDGFPSAQRQVDVPWQDYTLVPDVLLVPYDSRSNLVNLDPVCDVHMNCTTPPMQVVQGNPVTDASGTRQATVLFPSGTTAYMILSDDSVVSISGFHMRATEFSVGPNGPKAMPAPLPPRSAYTYEVEFSIDEAELAGAKEVFFGGDYSPVSLTENFLNFPVGWTIPVGEFDRELGRWIAGNNGRVIKILGVTDGLAAVDIDGSGQPADDLANLGFSTEELQYLASHYAVGQTLWRVPVFGFKSIK